MFKRIRHTQFWCVALGALAFSFCQGCIVVMPMRAPTHNIGASGEGPKGKVTLGFIHVGKTGREEVTRRLGWTDTGLKDDRLFLGRWASSSWGVYSLAEGGGEIEDWNRHWGTHNLLIQFDEKGLVKQYRVFPDSELVKELAAQVAESPNRRLDLSKPLEIPVALHGPKDTYFAGTLVLGNDSFEFREDQGRASHNFKISPKQIRTLSLTSLAHAHWEHTLGENRSRQQLKYINGTVRLTEKTSVGSEVTIRVDVPTVMVLVKYLAQTRPN